MSDFLNDVLQEARRVSAKVLNKIDELVNDEHVTQEDAPDLITKYRQLEKDYNELLEAHAELTDENDSLASDLYDTLDVNNELRRAVLLFLDGETRKTFKITPELIWTLDEYQVEVYYDTPNSITVRSKRD